MKEYITTLIGVVIVCGLVQILSPGEEGLKKHLGLISGLCVLCVMISPFASFIGKLSSSGGEMLDGIIGEHSYQYDYEKIYEDNLMSEGGANMSNGLKALITRDLGLDASSFDVSVKLGEGENEYLPDKVTVVLYKSALLQDPHDIIEYVNGLLSCECEIIYQ